MIQGLFFVVVDDDGDFVPIAILGKSILFIVNEKKNKQTIHTLFHSFKAVKGIEIMSCHVFSCINVTFCHYYLCLCASMFCMY